MKYCYFFGFLISHLMFPFIAISQTDQELVWGSYFGGSSYDHGTAIAELVTGGFVFTGSSESTFGLSTPGAYQTINAGSSDVFLARFDGNRNLMWSTYFGGSSGEVPTAIEKNSDGAIVISGTTTSQSNIVTPGAFQTEIAGFLIAGFIAKFSDQGMPIWSTYISGTGFINSISDLIVMENDDIVVVGNTNSNDFPISDDALQTEFGGVEDGFIARFNSEGDLLWSTYYGGSNLDRFDGIESDSEGNLLLTGYTESSTGISTTGTNQENYGGAGDLFILKLTGTGEMIWCCYFGGPQKDRVSYNKNIVFDEQDNFYITGSTESTSNIATAGAHQIDLIGDGSNVENIFLSKFSPSGNLIWSTYFGDEHNSGSSIDIYNDQIIMSGSATEVSDIIFGNPMLSSLPGPYNIFLSSFSIDGQPLWGTYFGGNETDFPTRLNIFSNGLIALTGETSSLNGIATNDGHQTQLSSIPDAFIAFFQINYNTGVNENELLPMSVFPNPSSETVRLQLPPSFSFMADVEVYDLAGRVVKSQQNFNAFDYFNLNVPPGMYVVVCRNGERVARTKVVVE